MPAPIRVGRRRIISGLVETPLLLGGLLSACENPISRAPTPTPGPTPRPPPPVLAAADIQRLLGSDYLDPELGFFVSYPSDWTVDPVEEEGLAVAFRAPVADTDATGTAYPTITADTYVPDDFPRTTTRFFLEITLENGIPLLEESLPAFELLAGEVQKIPAGYAALFEFRHGSENGRLHTMQLVVPGIQRVYSVTYTALDSVFEDRILYLAVVSTFSILGGR